jgi:hypothetical protein
VRRYLGTSWLSVREARVELGVSAGEVEELIETGRLSVAWLAGRPYASRRQVEELALRFSALDAAVKDWEEKGC